MRDEFWRCTPRELQSSLEADAKRLEREHNDRVWLAWHGAALTRTKRLPKLQALLAKKPSMFGGRRQTWQEQMSVMDMWVAKTGAIAAHQRAARA